MENKKLRKECYRSFCMILSIPGFKNLFVGFEVMKEQCVVSCVINVI
jgi:hypothetical protein